MINPCTKADVSAITAIINAAAQAYCGVIPNDCWHDPYMSQAELESEIAAGVRFWGWWESNRLVGVMGIQTVKDVTLIRHAYVHPDWQGHSIGSQLIHTLLPQAKGRLFVGTWADAHWAIRFYQRHGFRLTAPEEKDRLLDTYWTVSVRQRQTSVVLIQEF